MQITKPTLLLNESIAKRNISRMVSKAERSNARLRPHFKTHFSAEVASWYHDAGVTSCTVSSVDMAQYFYQNGWKDITIAFPFNRLEMPAINKMAEDATINLVIEDLNTLAFLKDQSINRIQYFIKLDVGTGRTGLPLAYDFADLTQGSEKVQFKGFLAHAGHTYKCSSNEAIIQANDHIIPELHKLKSKYGGMLSYGDTPSCSVVPEFSGVDELRPGNFIFYDWMQYKITSCSFEEIAVCMACPVVAKHADRNEIVIHGGAVHFSKDHLDNGYVKNFGVLVELSENGWKQLDHEHHLVRLSQEHGILSVSDPALYEKIEIGQIVGIIPIHSCLAANLMGSYLTLDGKRITQMPKNTFV